MWSWMRKHHIPSCNVHVCSTAGRVLDPLIVFSGRNLQSTWRCDKALPGMFYGVSENGWMTTGVFAEWFNKFVALVTERPLLLIFDRHLTHVSIKVIEKAIKENITILFEVTTTRDR